MVLFYEANTFTRTSTLCSCIMMKKISYHVSLMFRFCSFQPFTENALVGSPNQNTHAAIHNYYAQVPFTLTGTYIGSNRVTETTPTGTGKVLFLSTLFCYSSVPYIILSSYQESDVTTKTGIESGCSFTQSIFSQPRAPRVTCVLRNMRPWRI